MKIDDIFVGYSYRFKMPLGRPQSKEQEVRFRPACYGAKPRKVAISSLGTSKNAVMAQVWAAMIYYLLLSYIKFMSKARLSLGAFARRMKEDLMMHMDLLELLRSTKMKPLKPPDASDQIQMRLCF